MRTYKLQLETSAPRPTPIALRPYTSSYAVAVYTPHRNRAANIPLDASLAWLDRSRSQTPPKNRMPSKKVVYFYYFSATTPENPPCSCHPSHTSALPSSPPPIDPSGHRHAVPLLILLYPCLCMDSPDKCARCAAIGASVTDPFLRLRVTSHRYSIPTGSKTP